MRNEHQPTHTILKQAHDHVMRHGARLYVERVELGDVSPSTFLSADFDGARFYWRHQQSWQIAFGCVEDCMARGHERFESAQQATSRWHQQLLDPSMAKHLSVVGGFAFSTQTDPLIALGSPWRAFGDLRIWLPQVLIDARGDQPHALLCVWLKPGESVETWIERVEDQKQCLARWQVSDPQIKHTKNNVSITTVDDANVWADLVDETAQSVLCKDALQKVVLARRLRAHKKKGWSIASLMRALESKFSTCRTFAVLPPGAKSSWFVGASPECLVEVNAGMAYVDALAGTALPDVDEETFLSRQKDRIEHQLVVDAIEAVLAPLSSIERPQTPLVDRLSNVAHLRTPITAKLHHKTSTALSLASRLHPTPAVCGLPRAPARDFIESREGLDRGWYTGAIGWTNLKGDGEWDVAIRCALIQQDKATVYTGAGIVDASIGADEVEETDLKAQAMMHVLVGDVYQEVQ